MLAALHRHDGLVRLILTRSHTVIELEGSLYNSERELVERVTALWCALDRSHFTVACTLIDLGRADVNHGPYCPFLIDACRKGRLDIVHFLIENGYADVNQTVTNDANKASSLILSAQYDHTNIAAYLLDKDADIEYRTYVEQDTALTVAAREGHLAIIKLLCSASASITVKNHNRKTPMMLVAAREAFEAIDFLLEYMHDETTFDDLELIASSYLAHNNTITLDDRQRMVRLLRKSLEQRLLFHVPKTVAQSVAVYDFQIECQAIAERDHIQHNNDRLCLEALLICERILLFRKEELLFEPLFKRRVMMLVQNNQFDRCFHLNLNLFHLISNNQQSVMKIVDPSFYGSKSYVKKQLTTTQGRNLLHLSVNLEKTYDISYRLTNIMPVLSSLVVEVNSQICQEVSQYGRCSSNSACGCLHMEGASNIGICGFQWVTCSDLVPCEETNNYCGQSDHICVHHPRCHERPLCFPVSMMDAKLCPPMNGKQTSTNSSKVPYTS
ncbi:unnamed protein product [Rotaria socialis]|uniref:Uncharacterized protein n=1 Tax=Rotaria socialis TaxID=392032 RepID=A0A821SCR9_9BILA|nr:unnamed protein product [Rotaria socialis]